MLETKVKEADIKRKGESSGLLSGAVSKICLPKVPSAFEFEAILADDFHRDLQT